MDEHVLAGAIRLDEAIPLSWVEPLHCPHRHFSTSSKRTDQTNVIRQTNWWQLGGKKPSLYRNSDGCLPRKLTNGYRLSSAAQPEARRPASMASARHRR